MRYRTWLADTTPEVNFQSSNVIADINFARAARKSALSWKYEMRVFTVFTIFTLIHQMRSAAPR